MTQPESLAVLAATATIIGDFPMPHASLADSVSDNPITGSRWAGKSRCRIGTDPKGRGKYNKMVKRRKKKGYR